ncbi:uncharacterized protein I303_104005 [Kwoniella dejecticola CBS 10117]|uniref:F-box domain-containing protein n=1 Tax=Kwoniella dejecticola CBS 10117 TaxID=1296121 RepID=A0A1A6A8A8_9TREE|nr:uncharacterized protein I303_04023 [Kwoniella dejecticola CBS 10117]OBR86299.1 hypothetical protein I303_04023 [Kwoniella dejecticola CBS 10117]
MSPENANTNTIAQSASFQLGTTSDILSHICSYLPPPTLYLTLQVSKNFFHAAVPHLYRDIHVRSGMRDIFVGSKRSDNLTLESSFDNDKSPTDRSDQDPTKTKAKAKATYEINKNSLLRYIKRVEVSLHSINECPFVKQFIEPLPNLEVVHLYKGKRDTSLGEGEIICFGEKCQFLTKVCTQAERVIIRQLDLRPLRTFTKLREITIKIRPCELPFYMGGGLDRVTMQIGKDERTEEYLIKILSGVPKSTRNLELVWWDEAHGCIEDSYEVESNGWGFYPAVSSANAKTMRLMKGCNYCDQMGCVRYSPHVGVQLPIMFSMLGRKTDLEEIRVWNFEKTAKKNQWRDFEVEYEDLKGLLIKSFEEGRRQRNPPAEPTVAEKTRITFHSGLEYYHTLSKTGTGIEEFSVKPDGEEMNYWKNLYDPPEETVKLRKEVMYHLKKYEMEIFEFEKDKIEMWNEEECLRYLGNLRTREQLRKEERARQAIRRQAGKLQLGQIDEAAEEVED